MLLALSGHLTPAYIAAAVVGVVVLSIAVSLFALVFRSEPFAIRLGDWFGRASSPPSRACSTSRP